MAIKGGRKIIVRAHVFFWVLAGGKPDQWGNSPVYPHVVIQEEADKPGRGMTAYLKSRRFISEDAYEGRLGGIPHHASVTPADVRTLIEMALDNGWDPSSKTQYRSPPGYMLSDYTTCTLKDKT